MNKIDVAKIKSDFAAELAIKSAWFSRMITLTAGTATEDLDNGILCKNYLSSVYVDFECLVSDLIHGYINNKNSKYMSFIQNQIKQSISGKFSVWHSTNTFFISPKHINSAQLSSLLDPTNWNITFKSVAIMQQRASEWLHATHAAKFSALSSSDIALINAAHALRNCISHNSKNSRFVMNQAIVSIHAPPNCNNQGLQITRNNIQDVGKYLRAAAGNRMRVEVYAERIGIVGAAL